MSLSIITPVCVCVCACMQVTGEANETQICEALRRYAEREGFVREALFHLFSLTHVMEKARPDILRVRVHSPSYIFFPLTLFLPHAPRALLSSETHTVTSLMNHRSLIPLSLLSPLTHNNILLAFFLLILPFGFRYVP